MRRSIFVASQKGGAGKTTFARGLLDQLRSSGTRCAAFDADGNVGQLLQHHGTRTAQGSIDPEQDPLVGCGYFDIRNDFERDRMLEALDLDAEVLLFDLPGGVIQEIGKIVDAGRTPVGLLREYQDAGYRVTVVIVMTPMLASVRTVQNTIHQFGTEVDYVAVKNLAFGERDAFVLFDGYRTESGEKRGGNGKEALAKAGGQVIDLPALAGRTYALLDLYSLSFRAAITDPRLGRADRARVRHWVTAFEDEIEPAQRLLGCSES